MRGMLHVYSASALVVILSGAALGEEPAEKKGAALAGKAHALLKEHCYRCHGQDGANEGGLNFILRRDKLAAGGKYLVPGQPGQSLLYQRMKEASMPPEGEG